MRATIASVNRNIFTRWRLGINWLCFWNDCFPLRATRSSRLCCRTRSSLVNNRRRFIVVRGLMITCFWSWVSNNWRWHFYLQIREVVMSALIVRIYRSLLPWRWHPLNRCWLNNPGRRWRVKRRMVASSLIMKSWRFCWSRLNDALRRLKWRSWRWLINLAIRIIIVRKLNRWFFWQRNRPIILASCWLCRRLTRICYNIFFQKTTLTLLGWSIGFASSCMSPCST